MNFVRIKELAEILCVDPRTAKRWFFEQGMIPERIKLQESSRTILLYDADAVYERLRILKAEASQASKFVRRPFNGNTVLGKTVKQLGRELRGA